MALFPASGLDAPKRGITKQNEPLNWFLIGFKKSMTSFCTNERVLRYDLARQDTMLPSAVQQFRRYFFCSTNGCLWIVALVDSTYRFREFFWSFFFSKKHSSSARHRGTVSVWTIARYFFRFVRLLTLIVGYDKTTTTSTCPSLALCVCSSVYVNACVGVYEREREREKEKEREREREKEIEIRWAR